MENGVPLPVAGRWTDALTGGETDAEDPFALTLPPVSFRLLFKG